MLSIIHSTEIKNELKGKIIDLTKYNYIQYKVYNYNEDNILELNIKPVIELIQILQQIGYIWSNGLSLHINNFSELTEQGKLNKEILKTHRYMVFENDNHINLIYNFRNKIDLNEDIELISIEDVIKYYWNYKIEKIGIDIMPDYRDIMIGDYIHIDDEEESILEIVALEYERYNSYSPSRFYIKRTRKMDIRGHELVDEYILNYVSMKKLLRGEEKNKVKEINRKFQDKFIIKYRRLI